LDGVFTVVPVVTEGDGIGSAGGGVTVGGVEFDEEADTTAGTVDVDAIFIGEATAKTVTVPDGWDGIGTGKAVTRGFVAGRFVMALECRMENDSHMPPPRMKRTRTTMAIRALQLSLRSGVEITGGRGGAFSSFTGCGSLVWDAPGERRTEARSAAGSDTTGGEATAAAGVIVPFRSESSCCLFNASCIRLMSALRVVESPALHSSRQ